MNTTSLYKLVNSVIVKKYSWIIDCEISIYYDNPLEKYTILYYTDRLDISDIPNEVDKVERTTKNLFEALGPEIYQKLNEIEFVYNPKKL